MDRKSRRKLERDMENFQKEFDHSVESKVDENLSKEDYKIDRDLRFEGNIPYQVEVFKDGKYTIRRETTPESTMIGMTFTKDAMAFYVEDIKEKLRTGELTTEQVDSKIIEALEIAIDFLDQSIASHIPYVYEKKRVLDSLNKRNIVITKDMPK